MSNLRRIDEKRFYVT